MERGPQMPPAPPPQYTPDGRWFWNGTAWIPAAGVLGPAPPPPPAPPAVPRTRLRLQRWHAIVAAAIVAALVIAATVGIAFDVAAHRPPPPTPTPPPAGKVFEMPITSGLRSASVTEVQRNPYGTIHASGEITFNPNRAFELVATDGGQPVGQDIDVDGIDYTRYDPTSPWRATDPLSDEDMTLGWAGDAPPPNLRVTGLESVGGESAWHLVDGGGDNWWIGARSGHPLQFEFKGTGLDQTITFSRFDRQNAIQPPQKSQVSTTQYSGRIGTPVVSPLSTVDVTQVKLDPPGIIAPPIGYRYLGVQLSYRNTAADVATFDNQLAISAPDGSLYSQDSLTQVSPALPMFQNVASGQTVAGWDVFVVAAQAKSLLLRFPAPADLNANAPANQNVDYLISIDLAI
ncbi:MAG: hypothetical protein WAM30_19585 [Candidatus Dormiibacterota bacterium]